MTPALVEPLPGDIWIPRGKAGYHVYITYSHGDRVKFRQVVEGVPSDTLTVNRLSVFLSRFELLMRTKEDDANNS